MQRLLTVVFFLASVASAENIFSATRRYRLNFRRLENLEKLGGIFESNLFSNNFLFKDTFEVEQIKMEENHENEIQILETSVEEKEKYIANLEGRIIALENSKRSLEVENTQIRENSNVYQQHDFLSIYP